MDQAGLALRDLVPFIGSRAKVSEVLSGKRAITMPMARALHDRLGIPAEVLLQQPSATADQPEDDIQWHRFPLKEMAKRNWIPSVSDLTARAEDLIRGLIDRAGGWQVARAALYRKNDHLRTNAKTDPYALQAWCWQVLATANDNLPDVIRRDPQLTFFVIYQSEHAWERLEHVLAPRQPPERRSRLLPEPRRRPHRGPRRSRSLPHADRLHALAAASRRPHIVKPKSIASRSVEVKSSSVISPPPWAVPGAGTAAAAP